MWDGQETTRLVNWHLVRGIAGVEAWGTCSRWNLDFDTVHPLMATVCFAACQGSGKWEGEGERERERESLWRQRLDDFLCTYIDDNFMNWKLKILDILCAGDLNLDVLGSCT